MSDRTRCVASVWVKDTYRRTGRTKSGFEMHYNERQCKRLAWPGMEFCRQHTLCNATKYRYADVELRAQPAKAPHAGVPIEP